MALRRTLTKRLFFDRAGDSSPNMTVAHSPISSPSIHHTLTFHREFLASPKLADTGFLGRFLQRRGIEQFARVPEILAFPVGDNLREKIQSIGICDERLRLDGLTPPVEYYLGGVSVQDARKILRTWQLENLKSKLKQIPQSSISHSEFLQICSDSCSDQEQGAAYAKTLDDSGNVIVVGDVVFLRPDQVARSMEKMMSQSMEVIPRRKELEEMEKEKSAIDKKAETMVRGELYCGLGFLVVQTLGFMRLTFWELSWDVMEPICFFVTSLHFALAYGFFLKTSTEPSFEGYFQRRFKAKQTKLMKIRKFDLKRYNQLRRALY